MSYQNTVFEVEVNARMGQIIKIEREDDMDFYDELDGTFKRFPTTS